MSSSRSARSLERNDIAEWANSGGYIQHGQTQLNHRMIMMLHKCIEPLGESKSDYQIFLGIMTRLGYGSMFSEGGCTELNWCERIFNSTDLAGRIILAKFLKKGYYVAPPPAGHDKPPVDMRWFAEGRDKDVPEPNPLPGQYADGFVKGFRPNRASSSLSRRVLRRMEKFDPSRPAVNRYLDR